ncbi:PREDICTED: RING finger protein 225-like [Cyprinodon variegatus]|uniref:RING finger protein 225-like n=1 Tax=Cyprinodon variegatus TaxID=28743 RepID=UPI00074281AE|nr:PREDICTED: RING finger protein 225-like [Cyprinodon variegatus]XP_015250699.1 PREDICTED: RING finger protein 225-like [Cyprinodon variegatus]
MSGHGEGGRGTAPPQNVKPKPNPPPQNRRATKARRSRSSDTERADRSSRRRERDRHHGERRGRSEETRRRNGKEVERVQNRPVDVVEDTECAVCFCSYDNVFKTPKLLACGHTFCLECLARINVSSAEIKSLTCPVCRLPTELRKGRDLPRLGTNQDIIGKLPADMRRALSVRFKRSKGKLMLKHPPPGSKPPALPLNKPRSPAEPDAAEPGAPPAAVVDVGRPPNRMRGRVHRLFRSDQCYYVVVASIITITVALMLVGILAFVIIPNVALYHGPAHPGNSTSPPGGGP